MDMRYPMRLNENGLDITDVLAENISCVRELFCISKAHNKIFVVVFCCVCFYLFKIFWRI